MPVFDTSSLRSDTRLSPSDSHQVYCGLDNCVTLEVHQTLSRQFNQPPDIYAFERALQGPYLEMMLRGFAVDEVGRRQAAEGLRQRLDALRHRLNALAYVIWDKPLIKPGGKTPHWSVIQDFFYKTMYLPEIWLSQKGERKLSTNREVLEKLEQYLYARPFIQLILQIRDLSKQLEIFETEIDSDGRFRASYNIAGTETGRPSSSENAFGTGRNALNIANALRWPFSADPGMKLCAIDLEQVEARDVGFFCGCLFNDWTYLDAAESGDLHIANAKLVWPELPWTGQPSADKEIANRPFYRDFSYRDMAKRGGHLSNYSGTAWTASRHLKVPLPIMEEFQARYCRGRPASAKAPEIEPAFPCIPRFWNYIADELQLRGCLETPFGRKRNFFGRPGDDTTLREAIAFLPQSTTADRMNLGLWRVWKQMPQVQLLAQTYDSITFQYSEQEDEDEIVGEALDLIRVELRSADGRSYIVPGEAKVGWNWGNYEPAEGRRAANPEGLKKYSLVERDARRRTVGLQRQFIGGQQ